MTLTLPSCVQRVQISGKPKRHLRASVMRPKNHGEIIPNLKYSFLTQWDEPFMSRKLLLIFCNNWKKEQSHSQPNYGQIYCCKLVKNTDIIFASLIITVQLRVGQVSMIKLGPQRHPVAAFETEQTTIRSTGAGVINKHRSTCKQHLAMKCC